MSLRGRHARTTSLAATSRFLIVTVGGTHFALHADRVQGLLTLEEAASAGSLTRQGVTYASTDLAMRLHLPADADGPETRVVLLSHGTSRGNIRVAQVHGLKELDQSQVLSLPRHFQGEEQTWYQGMVLFEESVAVALNPDWLMEGCAAGQALGIVERHGELPEFLSSPPTLTGGQV